MNFMSAIGGAMNAHDAYRRADQAEELQKMQLEAHRTALDEDKLAREVTRMVYENMAAKKAAAKTAGTVAPIAPIAAIPDLGVPRGVSADEPKMMANGGPVKNRFSGVYDDTAVSGRLPTIYQQRLQDLETPREERGNMRHAWSEISRHITAMADGGAVTNGVGTTTNFADGGGVRMRDGSSRSVADWQKTQEYYTDTDPRSPTYAGETAEFSPAERKVLEKMRSDQRRDKAESKAPTTKTEMGKGMANGGPVHKTIFDFMHHHLGKKQKGAVQMKKGGMVRGPGTGTSDSVKAKGPGGAPYRLSDGEYVLSADTVRAVGKHNLDALQARHHKPVR